MSLYLFFVTAAVVVFFAALVYRRHRDTGSDIHPQLWTAAIYAGPDAVSPSHIDTFPVTVQDFQSAMKLWLEEKQEELEDEAATYGSFVAFDRFELMTPEAQVVVEHPLFGRFYFRADYMEGYLIGIEKDERETPARPAQNVIL